MVAVPWRESDPGFPESYFRMIRREGGEDMEFLKYDTRRFFLFGVRLFFGLWFLYVGLSKWIFMGPAAFVGAITSQFDKTWSPHALNVFLAWVIMIAEPVLALLILSGRKARMVWTLTSLLMFQLTVGQTILMKPDVIANWQFLVLVLLCAALSDPDPVHGTGGKIGT